MKTGLTYLGQAFSEAWPVVLSPPAAVPGQRMRVLPQLRNIVEHAQPPLEEATWRGEEERARSAGAGGTGSAVVMGCEWQAGERLDGVVVEGSSRGSELRLREGKDRLR